MERPSTSESEARGADSREAECGRPRRGEPRLIVYADASALVKRYVVETGSDDIVRLTSTAAAVATALVTRAEVAAAFAKAVRVGALDEAGARRAQRRFTR